MTPFYKEAVIDSVVFIGARMERDQFRKPALRILTAFLDRDIRKVYLTDYVLLESVNFLLRKESFETARDCFDSLITSERIEIVPVDAFMLQDMKKLFSTYKNLSLTDCSIVQLMKDKGIKHLFSFDAGFDTVKGIERRDDVE